MSPRKKTIQEVKNKKMTDSKTKIKLNQLRIQEIDFGWNWKRGEEETWCEMLMRAADARFCVRLQHPERSSLRETDRSAAGRSGVPHPLCHLPSSGDFLDMFIARSLCLFLSLSLALSIFLSLSRSLYLSLSFSLSLSLSLSNSKEALLAWP